MYFANCHCHSTFSDGMYTPEQLCALAAKEGYKAIVLTDHDTHRGSYFMNRAARRFGLLNISATEFYAVGYGTEFHMLGFDYNPEAKKIKAILERASSRATIKTKFLFEKGLSRGILRDGICWQDVIDAYPYNDYICNNQVFEVMVSRGIYKKEEYFDLFLKPVFGGATAKSYGAELTELLPDIPHAEVLVEAIKEAGGVPVIAHPHNKEPYLKDLLNAGIMGFETSHPSLTAEERVFYDKFCVERGLYRMGGTDHSGLLSGLAELNPAKDCDPSDGYVTEECFMEMYARVRG